jgi:hypothetical protein
LVSSPIPSIATVTVLTGSFITPTPTRRSAGDQIAGQQRHVVRDLTDEFADAVAVKWGTSLELRAGGQ